MACLDPVSFNPSFSWNTIGRSIGINEDRISLSVSILVFRGIQLEDSEVICMILSF